MIPPKAIKKVKNETHLEMAAGFLLFYKIFPRTNEGIEQAKKTAASKDTWLAPSDLPEYYNDIDSDIMMGRENDAIRAIRNHFKEFYGISSAGTADFVDTSVVDTKPKTPAGLPIRWYPVNQVGEKTWRKLRVRLTGVKDELFGKLASFVNLPERDADKLIQNIKQSGYYPGLENESGNNLENYINWLVDTYLPEYGQTQIYNPGDKFVDDGKEFADEIVDNLDTALEKKSDEIMDAIDAIIAEDKRRIEEFKAKVTRKVNHPELFPELQHIKTRYMWGQNGLYDLEFKSDIDRAIYFAGKLGGDNKNSQDKVAVRQWLLLVTGLSVHDDYEKIKEYRAKILELILQLVKLHPDKGEIIVPPVYDGYYQDPDEEEEEEEDEEEMDDEEYDDLYGSSLDDLLGEIKEDEKKDQEQEQKQVVENIEEEILDDAEEDEEDPLSDEDLERILNDEGDGLEDIAEKLLPSINKPKKESTYTSNKKIFDAIISNFGRIQATLDIVNKNLENQNELIKASIETQLAIGELISSQTNILEDKFSLILDHFESQAKIAQDQSEALDSKAAEDNLEAQRDAAGIADYQDLTKGPQKKKRKNKIEQYLKSRLTRKLYRKLPKSVRNARQRVRKLQRIPDKVKANVANKITSMLPSKGQQAARTLSKVRGMGNISRVAGPAKYVFAGLEYSERKQSGQSEIQALSGVGGGLAGAAAGGAAGAKAGAALGVLLGGPPGAAIGAVLGGLLGSIGGGMAGSGIADKVTGAHETGSGLTKPGTAILHGTEAVIKKDAPVDMSPMSTLGGVMLAATSQYINSAGAVAAPIAPTFKGIAGQMAKEYDVPSTVTQTNVGGALPQLDKELKKVKEKRTGSAEEEFTGKEKELLDTQNDDLFAERLLSMIDPEGKLENLLKSINSGGGGGGGGGGGEMDLNLIGDGAFDTGLRTGPSGVIGGSAAFHQDLSFGPNVSMEDKRKLILQMAIAYDKVGRRMMLSNQGVHGDVFPVNGTKDEQIKWITDAEKAHRARNGGTGRNAIDFYTPVKGEDMFGKSVENTPMLAPVVEGAETKYFSGGGAGAGMSIVKDGVEILKLIHGRTDIALPKGGKIPSTIAKPQQQPATPAATATPPAQAVSSTSQFSAAPNNLMASVTNLNSPTYNNFISPSLQNQNTVVSQIEQLSSQEEQSTNDMLIINNQQPQMPSVTGSQQPMIFSSPGKSSAETMKDLLHQRLATA